jgi:hypothetical protein
VAHGASNDPSSPLVGAIESAYRRPHGVPEQPYAGLASFERQRAGYLAGRDWDVDHLSRLLQMSPSVVLCGPSGCGKSSLAVAGVAARIDEDLLDGVDGWKTAVLRPSLGQFAHLMRQLEEEAAAPAADGTGLLIIIDQLEELLTLPEDRRSEVAKLIARLARGGEPRRSSPEPSRRQRRPMRLVATVRDDLFGRVAAIPELDRFPERNLYVVRGVEPHAMRDVVVAPLSELGYQIDDERAIVAEARRVIERDPGALPLIQFALNEWWERRETSTKRLKHADWLAIEGVEGALARAAQTLHDELPEPGRQRMKVLLLALFRSDGTRRLVQEEVFIKDPDSRVVLGRLVERRLVRRRSRVGDGEPFASEFEVVHEALATRWPVLRGWLEATRAIRELHEDIEYSAKRWSRDGNSSAHLWRGDRALSALQRFSASGSRADVDGLTLSPTAIGFLNRSVDADRIAASEDYRKRWASSTSWIVAGAVLTIGAGIGAHWLMNVRHRLQYQSLTEINARILTDNAQLRDQASSARNELETHLRSCASNATAGGGGATATVRPSQRPRM